MIPRLGRVISPINYYWKSRRIVLGRSTCYSHGLEYEEPYVNVACNSYGITSFVAGPSRGKSVLWKRVVDQALIMQPGRHAIIFDAQGVDGVLMKYPSAGGLVFERLGEYRFGHERIRGFTPYWLREDANPGDALFKIPWSWLETDEIVYLLSQSSDAKSWIAQFSGVLRKHKNLVRARGLRWLLAEFEEKMENEKYRSPVIPATVGKLEVFSIVRSLAEIVERGYLAEDDDPLIVDVVGLMQKGVIPVINLHLDRSVPARMYVGVLLRQIYVHYARRQKFLEARGARPLGPVIVAEEFSQIAPKRELGAQLSPVELWVSRIVKQGMKIRFDLYLIVQDTMDIAPEIRRSIFGQRIFVSNASPEDLGMLARKFGRWIVELAQELDSMPDEFGAYEWLVIDNVPMTFRPGVSLSEFHRR